MASARAIKIAMVGSIIFLGCVVIGNVVGWLSGSDLAQTRHFAVIPGIPVAAALMAEMALRDGITHRTLLYPLLGPVPRRVLAVVRTVLTGLVLGTCASVLVLVIHVLEKRAWGGLPEELLAIYLGALAYTALFGIVHLLTHRGLIASLAIYAIFDHPIGRLPFSLRNIAPSFHVRVLGDLESSFRIPVIMDLGKASNLESSLVLIVLTVIATGLVAFLFTRKNLGELC
jgi:hypothetical protein